MRKVLFVVDNDQRVRFKAMFGVGSALTTFPKLRTIAFGRDFFVVKTSHGWGETNFEPQI